MLRAARLCSNPRSYPPKCTSPKERVLGRIRTVGGGERCGCRAPFPPRPKDPSAPSSHAESGADSADGVDEALVSEVASLHDQLGELSRRIESYRRDMPQKSAAVIANLKDHVSAVLDLRDRALNVRVATSCCMPGDLSTECAHDVGMAWLLKTQGPTRRRRFGKRRRPPRPGELVSTRSLPSSRSIASPQTTSSQGKTSLPVLRHFAFAAA